jgi:hypothetical protein
LSDSAHQPETPSLPPATLKTEMIERNMNRNKETEKNMGRNRIQKLLYLLDNTEYVFGIH